VRRLAPLLLAAAAAAQDPSPSIVEAELARDPDAALFDRALRSEAAGEREAAARALGRIREPHSAARLLPLLRDPDGAVRRAAIFALGQIGGSEPVIPLRESLEGREAAELALALEALGKSKDPRALPAIAPWLSSPLDPVRRAAALGLFRLGDPAALPHLFAALARRAEDGSERWPLHYAAWRLARVKAPEGAPEAWSALLLRGCERDRPFEERVFGTLALGAVAPEAPAVRERLLALLDDADPRVVVAASRALTKPWRADAAAAAARRAAACADPLLVESLFEQVQAGGKEAAPILASMEAPMSLTPRLRLLHANALAAAGVEPGWIASATPSERETPEWEEALWRASIAKGALPEAWPKTLFGRIAAADALADPSAPEEPARIRLVSLLGEADPVLRATAVASLGRRKAAPAAPEVVAAARRSAGALFADVRIEAAGALAAMGLFDPWLEEAAAGDPERPVREAARSALAALGRAPPRPPAPAGFRLNGRSAAVLLPAARALRGARVLLETDRGTIEILLLPDEAPVHCVSFAELVLRGFYDGLSWHRVVADFVIQGGCPRGDGSGGPGYLLPDEIGARPFLRGTVGMPKSVDDTGGCQIFITHLPTPHLDGRYTVFGQVVSGLAAVDAIRVGDRIRKATLRRDPPG